MGCMNPLPEGRAECGICGYPANGENPSLYLPVGTVLSERYLVGRVLEVGGDGAVYIGYDKVLKSAILIREFLPDTLCGRAENGTSVAVIGGCENTFRDYRERFRTHARALARLRELPSLIPLYDIFDENGTAYTVGEHCEGLSLEERLGQLGGRMSWDEARPLFMPLMSTLIAMHSAGICHYGLSPSNLVLAADGRLHMRGFSIQEARSASTDLKPRMIPGYSAPEQYGAGGEMGAWTDVYGLAAVIFRALTGNPPPEALSRVKQSSDLLVPADVAQTLPDHVAVALYNALQVRPDARTRTMKEFRDKLAEAPAISAMRRPEEDPSATAPVREPERPSAKEATREEEPEEPPKSNRGKYAVLIVLSAFIVLLLVAGVVIVTMFPDVVGLGGGDSDPDTSNPSVTTTTTVPSVYVPAAPQYAVEDLIGQNYFDIKDQTFQGNMKIKLKYQVFSDEAPGTIVDQTPSPEQSADEGSAIEVVISAGPETLTVPDVSGWEAEHARLYLEALGFRVESVTLAAAEVERGLVQDTTPAQGASLNVGETITLRVSDKEPEDTTADDPDNPAIPAGGTDSREP